MSLRDVVREFKELPLAMLDRPQLDARINRDEQQLDDLAGNIARNGVILPLAVVRVDDRYEIIDGFCRYIAATRAGLVVVPCVIYPDKETALEGVKYAANLFRLDMTPAEEAIFFHELLHTECHEDIDQLCALVNKKLSYVDARLALLSGDAEIFEAVRAGKLKLGVAAELNKIPAEDYRRYYLTHAIKGGATVGVVSGWVAEWKSLYADRGDVPAAPAPVSGPTVSQPFDLHFCAICRRSDPHYIPEQISVHTHCKLAVLEPLLATYRGEA